MNPLGQLQPASAILRFRESHVLYVCVWVARAHAHDSPENNGSIMSHEREGAREEERMALVYGKDRSVLVFTRSRGRPPDIQKEGREVGHDFRCCRGMGRGRWLGLYNLLKHTYARAVFLRSAK